jgi:SAM-dependent methyltransferase
LSFYPADLARIHDEGFGDFARAAACELHRRLPPAGRVVEFGCGTGISTQILARLGYELVGIDISSDMLAIARQRVPAAEFHHASIWDAEIPDCVGVSAIGEVVNYAADERAGAERLPELFSRIHEALDPGGVFVFDFATPGRAGPPGELAGDGWRIHAETTETGAELVRRITIESGGHTREEVHRLWLYEPQFVRGLLDDAGFSPAPLERYCDFAFWPGYAAFAASVR